METRELGRTGEQVPTIGLGTWEIGAYANESERVAQVRALRRGIELGCSLIDTAEVYANGRSEEVVAEAISGQREHVFIASKVSQRHLQRDEVIEACARSLRRLGTTYIDLYQVHWPNPGVPIRETMAGMEELVRTGKIRYVGVSNFSVEQTADARSALAKSELVSNQVEYSLVSRSAEAAVIPYCERERLSVIAYSPLARGRVPVGLIPSEVCDRHRLTPAQVMLNWATRKESVVAIPKSADMRHIEENASAVSVRLSKEEYDAIGTR